MSITKLQTATLAAAFGTQAVARVKDDEARNMARQLVIGAREAKRNAASQADETARDYTPEQRERMERLFTVVWPRMRRVTNAMRAADADSRTAMRDHDANGVYDNVLRAHRLSVLAERIRVQARRVGAFPISLTDRHADTSRFIRSAKWRRFIFPGGRDVVSNLHSDEDVLQGAFVRALEAGDAVNGIPAFGTLFGHVQAERAHLTRIAGLDWRGLKDALLGGRAIEAAYPATDDVHAMRKLGTRHVNGLPYGTRDTHAAAMGDMERDAQRANAEDAVTREARELALLAGDADAFPRQLATVLLSGVTLADVSEALGLTVSTIRDRALIARDAVMASGIDHTTRDDNAERDTAADYAMERHGRESRAKTELIRRALYLANHGATRAVILPNVA